jgi:hypothetical protein
MINLRCSGGGIVSDITIRRNEVVEEKGKIPSIILWTDGTVELEGENVAKLTLYEMTDLLLKFGVVTEYRKMPCAWCRETHYNYGSNYCVHCLEGRWICEHCGEEFLPGAHPHCDFEPDDPDDGRNRPFAKLLANVRVK